MGKLKVTVVTPQKSVAHSEVDKVTATTALGQLGILPGHRALLADLEPGELILTEEDWDEVYAASDGFIEVDRDNVRVLAETAERVSDIDVARAKEALKDAQAQLETLDPTSPEYAEQQARRQRAQVRLRVAGK